MTSSDSFLKHFFHIASFSSISFLLLLSSEKTKYIVLFEWSINHYVWMSVTIPKPSVLILILSMVSESDEKFNMSVVKGTRYMYCL